MNFVLSPYRTTTADILAEAANRRGLNVVRLPREGIPPLRGPNFLYAARLFGDIVARPLQLGLLEPPAAWLTTLPEELTGRHVATVPIHEAWALRRPMFIKPADGKRFPARVYMDGAYLPGPDALDPSTPVLVSERVNPLVEYRIFVLDAASVTASRYATRGTLDEMPLEGDARFWEVLDFAREVLEASSATLPSAVVIDVAEVDLPDGTRRFVVVEANAAWSSGLYACDPDRALDAVLRSAGPLDAVTHRDRPFLRDTSHPLA